MDDSIKDRTILIFGGSGSLGRKLIQKYIDNNTIINYSRDEWKHWEMNIEYKEHRNKSFYNFIGDIRNKTRVEECLIEYNPHIIIIASAMKHIDICELAISECIQTNLIGIRNVIELSYELKNLNIETVCMVSTDKACSPVNSYGMCKAISERSMIEKAYYCNKNDRKTRYVTVRYGNVLTSRGSILPILHKIGQDSNIKEFSLTHEDMTRFIMLLDESVELIDYTIKHAESGQIIVPKLKSMNIKDLIELFSEKYNKPYKITGIRPGEKLHESMINNVEMINTKEIKNNYFELNPYFNTLNKDESVDDKQFINNDFSSNDKVMTKNELDEYLKSLNLL